MCLAKKHKKHTHTKTIKQLIEYCVIICDYYFYRIALQYSEPCSNSRDRATANYICSYYHYGNVTAVSVSIIQS